MLFPTFLWVLETIWLIRHSQDPIAFVKHRCFSEFQRRCHLLHRVVVIFQLNRWISENTQCLLLFSHLEGWGPSFSLFWRMRLWPGVFFCPDMDCWNIRVGNLDNTESAPSAKLKTIYNMSKFASAYTVMYKVIGIWDYDGKTLNSPSLFSDTLPKQKDKQ